MRLHAFALFAALAAIPWLSGALAAPGQSVVGTRHNLLATGPGEIKASEETRVCIFCHTPHTSEPVTPLWNRADTTTRFTPYASPTLDAGLRGAAPQPTGSSKLCLSCHDGTIALGAVRSRKREIPMRNTLAGRLPPGRRAHLGSDLSGMHPISFTVTDRLITANNTKDSPLASLTEMRANPDVRLDKQGRMQCTTCHDAHDDSNHGPSGVPFYTKPRFADACLVCHRL